jgi:hypothetical protein
MFNILFTYDYGFCDLTRCSFVVLYQRNLSSKLHGVASKITILKLTGVRTSNILRHLRTVCLRRVNRRTVRWLLERIWKQAVMAKFRKLSWHWLRGTEENKQTNNFRQKNQSASRDLNLGPPKCDAGVINIRQRRSFWVNKITTLNAPLIYFF